MAELPMDLDELIEMVRGQAQTPLDQLRVASGLAKDLGGLAEGLRDHFVAECRKAGLSWEEVGVGLRVTRQAAQRRFVGRLRAVSRLKPGSPKRTSDARNESGANENGSVVGGMMAMAQSLVDGPTGDLVKVPRMTGGAAGVFTIWFKGKLLFLGHARNAAEEAKESNWDQADGARGRLVGVRRQPTASIQRALKHFFPEEFFAAEGLTEQKKAATLLKQQGKYRMVETDSGPEAVELFGYMKRWLTEHDYHVLADEVR